MIGVCGIGQASGFFFFLKFWLCLGIHGRNSCISMVVRLALIPVYLRYR